VAKITSSSTAEYFAKNLQQVGFSSPLKAVLTTLKEALDNSLDACESAGVLPEITVQVEKLGPGSSRSTDLIRISVKDNGPGLELADMARVFGEYLASSKFGKGECSRGQQGIGISAATTWAQLTNAKGVRVISKTSRMRQAVQAQIDVDIKSNKGIIKHKESIAWDRPHGVAVEFVIDGRVQLNGDGGLLTYLEGTILVNPHVSLKYKLMESDWVSIPRVTDEVPKVPTATAPHPHTMKLGEFMTHAGLYGKVSFEKFLRTGFSRVTEATIKDFIDHGLNKALLNKPTNGLSENDFKNAFRAIQETPLTNPNTRSVLVVGEEALAKSIMRLGDVDFFSVVARKPRICDFKPVVVEVALARFRDRSSKEDEPVQVLRFANRVPLQFDKSACAITRAIESINWKSYGLSQPKKSVPSGPYIFAVSVVSPFIKFKNASKETIDSSDDLVEEIRRALMQAGQRLSRHIRREDKEADLERKLQHLEQFGPILVKGLARLTKASQAREKRAEEGLVKLLGRDTMVAQTALATAEARLDQLKSRQADLLGPVTEEGVDEDQGESAEVAVNLKSKKSLGKASEKQKKKSSQNSSPRQLNKAKKNSKKTAVGAKLKKKKVSTAQGKLLSKKKVVKVTKKSSKNSKKLQKNSKMIRRK
jgi:DNA topoisomerase-6 subunit B